MNQGDQTDEANRFENIEFMLKIFRLFNLLVESTPILSFKDTKPKNVLISLKKHKKYVEKTKNEIIIHSNSSKYSKQVEDWFR